MAMNNQQIQEVVKILGLRMEGLREIRITADPREVTEIRYVPDPGSGGFKLTDSTFHVQTIVHDVKEE